MRLFLEQYCVDLGTRLESVSPRLAKQVVDFCQSLWRLYKVSVAKTLVDNWKDFTDDYTKKFLALHHSIGLMDTLKQHILVTHVPKYFDLHGVTLRASSEEYLETTHSSLRMMEERFRVRTKGRKRGTAIHQERLLRSSYLFNFCLTSMKRNIQMRILFLLHYLMFTRTTLIVERYVHMCNF